LIAFMRTLATEGRSRNVLTNAIAPFAATPMTERQGALPESVRAAMPPELVAPMVALLVSEQTRMNGQVIVAGKGVFRRAASVEGRGHRYADGAQITPEALTGDLERILNMEDAAEFADAMASFQDLFSRRQEEK
jgi:3-hydroxyacyl-CoA dehydrogenase/3a,7a,12a-trihydroxy-5b-cholest-24-enoyl-CoA hydratase